MLSEFLSSRDKEGMFRELAKKGDFIIFNFHKVKTLDKVSFDALLKIKKALSLLGKKAVFCCLPPTIAAIISMWEEEVVEVVFDDIF